MSHQSEQRRRNVFKCATASQLHPLRIVVDKMKRNWIGRVRGVRTAGYRVNHLLRVSVIGGDNCCSPSLPNSFSNPSQACIDVLAGFNFLIELFGGGDPIQGLE